jgi:hypothetical protein
MLHFYTKHLTLSLRLSLKDLSLLMMITVSIRLVKKYLGTFKVDLINDDDDTYSAYFFFGDKANPARLIFDTNSDWMYVTSKECENCLTHAYDRQASTSQYVESYIPEYIYVSLNPNYIFVV